MSDADALADMLVKVVAQLREALTIEDLKGLACVMALQELCVEAKDALEHREPVDTRSMRAHSGRCTLELLGVSDAMVERFRMTLQRTGPAPIIESNWRN